jgi:hypothetical protein
VRKASERHKKTYAKHYLDEQIDFALLRTNPGTEQNEQRSTCK